MAVYYKEHFMNSKKVISISVVIITMTILFSYWKTNESDGTALLEINRPVYVISEENNNVKDVKLVSNIKSTAVPPLIKKHIIPAENNQWLTPPTSELSNEILEFTEQQNVSYVDTIYYPFSDDINEKLVTVAKSGEVILFDNSQPDYLDSYGVSSGEIVANYFGAAESGDAIVAVTATTPEEGTRYLVLSVKKDKGEKEFVADVKDAIKLIKERQELLADGTEKQVDQS